MQFLQTYFLSEHSLYLLYKNNIYKINYMNLLYIVPFQPMDIERTSLIHD